MAIGSASFGKADAQPWRLLESAGVEVRPNALGRPLSDAETLAHVRDADGWIAGSERVSREILAQAPRLRAVARIGVGVDNVDLEAARELGIAVSTTPDAPTRAVAEMTVGVLLALTRHLVQTTSDLRQGRWIRRLGTDLFDLPILVVGYGRIGRRTAELLQAFGARILICDPALDDAELGGSARRVSLEEGLAEARVVTLHASGNEPILDAAAFAAMQDGVLVLNAARGGLIDESALLRALESGRVGGCWLDVFGEEPYDGPLLQHDHVLATPHAATFSRQCRLQMEVEAVQNLLRDLGLPTRAS